MRTLKTLFDLRGLVIHSLHQGTDREPITLPNGDKVNSVPHCLNNFVNNYLLPSSQDTRLNDIIAVLDAGNDYRKALYPAYKADRPSAPEMSQHIRDCMASVTDLFKGLGIPMVEVKGVEADDVLAYLVEKIPHPKILRTVDQDMLQLSSPDCVVFLKDQLNTDGYALYNSASPKALLMNVLPRHVALCKSIIGDSSDNYKGVAGVGPAAFAKLAEDYGLDGLDDLARIVATDNYDELDQAIAQTGDKTLIKLREQRDEWKLGWNLANLNPGLVGERKPSGFNNLVWTKRLPDPSRVNATLSAHGCGHLWSKLKPILPTKTLITADNFPDLTRFAAAFANSPVIAVDWETTDQLQHQPFKDVTHGREFVDMLSSTITGAGITFGRNYEHTVYLSFDHADTNNLDRGRLLDILGLIPEHTIIAVQNTMFENTLLRTNFSGVSLGNCYDTKVMASYVDENQPAGLKERSRLHLNYNQIKYTDVIAKGKTMSDYSAAHVFQYGADDPLVTAHLFDFYRTVMEMEGTWDFCIENEFLPIEMVSEGFIAGVSLDEAELNRQRQEDRQVFDESIAAIRSLIEANQTEESIAAGVENLYAEEITEARAKAQVAGESGDNEAEKLRKKLEQAVRYTPYEVTETEIGIDLVPSDVNPLLDMLSIPRLEAGLDALRGFKPADFLKKQEAVAAWAAPYAKTSEEAAKFFQLLIPAIKYNQTSKAKMDKKEGRNHPCYLEWQQYALAMRGRKVKTTATGFEMNLGSPPQMSVLLYGMLGLPMRLRGFEVSETRKKLGITEPSVQANEDAILTALAEDCQEEGWRRAVLQHLLKAKKCATRLSLFYDVYPSWVHPKDGLIHPQVNTCGTETRRPSGSSPNPLQWPKRGDGVKFRRCILPNQKLGHDLIVSIDWSQQELRVAGALSMDEAMLDCYIGSNVAHVLSDAVKEQLGQALLERFLQAGTKDIHTQTASGLLKWAYEEVEAALNGEDKDMAKKAKSARTAAKPINFGGTYGIGAGKLSRKLTAETGVPHSFDHAKQFLNDKKALYHGFERWREHIIELVNKQGYVTTALGNRRHVFEQIVTPDEGLWASVCRQVVNYLIQGICADNLKRTMTTIWKEGILQRTGAVLVAPIYDELVFSAHSSTAVDLIMSVHRVMTRDIPGLPVPMLAEPSLGVNFGDQIEIGPFPTPEAIQRAVNKALGTQEQEEELKAA